MFRSVYLCSFTFKKLAYEICRFWWMVGHYTKEEDFFLKQTSGRLSVFGCNHGNKLGTAFCQWWDPVLSATYSNIETWSDWTRFSLNKKLSMMMMMMTTAHHAWQHNREHRRPTWHDTGCGIRNSLHLLHVEGAMVRLYSRRRIQRLGC
jgi:hypothetical protein